MAVGHLLLSLAIGAVADHAASLPSRLSSSRVIAAGESPQSPPVECSKQALANVLRMCGGLVHDGKCDVVLIGCGAPKRGMGWYHSKQMLDGDVPSAALTAIVEPFFLGVGSDSEYGPAFATWAQEMEQAHSTKFLSDVSELEVTGTTLGLIAGRTADNPRLFKEAIAAGCTHIYLEKPGAPTVAELEEMKAFAASKGVPVFMGYNKNVTPYVLKALEFELANAGAMTTFVHNNAYTEEELGECFERNAEGMLKNMAIHELALLVVSPSLACALRPERTQATHSAWLCALLSRGRASCVWTCRLIMA